MIPAQSSVPKLAGFFFLKQEEILPDFTQPMDIIKDVFHT